MAGQERESTLTVVLALAANLGIAVAKIIAALLTGSASMAAEAAHSVADTSNEVLLIVGLRRSGRPADRRHPLGYGKERYIWTLLVTVTFGPDRVLLCARLDFRDDLTAGDVERACVRMAHELREAQEEIDEVFLEPVPRDDPELRARVIGRYGGAEPPPDAP